MPGARYLPLVQDARLAAGLCDRELRPASGAGFAEKDAVQYKDIQTTMRYVETARKMKKAAEAVYVPDFLTRKVN